MNEALIIALVALLTSSFNLGKQIFDNKQIKKWICTRNPCKDRVSGEEPEK